MRWTWLASVAFLAGLLGQQAAAHPPSIVAGPGERAIAEEVLDFRKRMAAAIRKQDKVPLRAMYAEHFQHIDTAAKFQDREARIASASSGVDLIETVQPREMTVRAHAGGWTAVVHGLSTLPSKADGKRHTVRWTAVYVRTEASWQVAASQETFSHEIKP